MPIKLLIVGIGGVGKEHIRAAVTLGLDNIVLMDTSKRVIAEFIKGRVDGYVLNKWGNVEEKIPLQDGFTLIDDFAAIDSPPTHVIIATPTETHEEVVLKVKTNFPRAKILLEKPISENGDKVIVDYVGYNYDFKFREGANVLVLCNSKEQKDNGNIVFDLLSHLIAVAVKNNRQVSRLVVEGDDSCAAFTYEGDVLVAMRRQNAHTVFFNGKSVDVNYERLFTEQIRRFVGGESNYNLAAMVEDICGDTHLRMYLE